MINTNDKLNYLKYDLRPVCSGLPALYHIQRDIRPVQHKKIFYAEAKHKKNLDFLDLIVVMLLDLQN